MPTNAIALTRLLVRERPSLLRLAERLIGDRAAAEDVTQSLWLRVQRVEDHPPIANRRAYLFRLATNVALDWRRAKRRRDALFETGDLPEHVAAALPRADHALIDRESLAIVMAALDELPSRTRDIFVMRRLDEMSIDDIAERVGLGRSMVLKLLKTALLHCDARLHADRE